MKYFMFILVFFFLTLEKQDVNYICKKDNKILFFEKAHGKHLHLDKYSFFIKKIGFFNCKKQKCILQKVIKNETFISSKQFFKDCIKK